MRDHGLLSCCLVDSDSAALASSRRRRQQALLVSILVQGLLLAALLLAPLAAPGVLPQRLILVPGVPYRGNSVPDDRPPRRASNTSYRPTNHLFYVDHIHGHSGPAPIKPTSVGESAGSAEAPLVEGGPPGSPNGLIELPAGGNSSGVNIPVPPSGTRSASHPIKRSEGVEQALLIHRVDPVYPRIAIQARLEGTVRLHAIIGRDGMVESLEVLSGPAVFVQPTLEAVQQWRYRPTLLSGEPVEVETYITVIFEMKR
jgi:protein TonB